MELGGFFATGDVARFVAARDLAHRQLRCAPNQHLTLVDMRQMQIQSQDAVAEFQKVLASPATASKRIAFVIAASLSRLQLQRAARGRETFLFKTPEEAEAWLLAEHESRPAA